MFKVTGGEKKGYKLHTPEGYEVTRPATGLLKKAMFDMIGKEIEGANLLDLYCGTGAISIEAFSRGAEFSLLVDLSRESSRMVAKNLEITDYTGKAVFYQKSVSSFISTVLPNMEEKFDYIFVDPPYDELTSDVNILRLLTYLKEDGVLFIETREFDSVLIDKEDKCIKEERLYGSTKLTMVVQKTV